MAPRPHHLVLRDLRAPAAASSADYEPFDPAFGYLFNSYYETVGDRHPRAERGLLSRPGVNDIAAYRAYVDAAVLAAIDDMAPELLDLVELGLHHEQQHQELLLMDIKHVLWTNPLRPAYRSVRAGDGGDERPAQWTEHDGGLVEIGHDRSGPEGSGFAFDNESPRHRVFVQRYAIADRPVTCGDWLGFIADGGYQRPDLWLSDGWAAVQAQGWRAPLYWEPDGDDADDWRVFTLGGCKPVNSSEPVCHVSYYEADAFARWSGARLPTEAEWENAAARSSAEGRFLDLDRLHPGSTSGGRAAPR